MVSFKCSICDRPMPPRVYQAHLKKRHFGVTPPVEAVLPVATEEKKEEIVEPKIEPSVDNLSTFNFGEINTCQMCREEYPSKIMEFHMHIRHGM